MSFYKDASLVFLPSGGAGKDGKAYSMKPTDGSGDFTFSRGSNLTATRIDSNGLIAKGRENLLKQSNQFDTTWLNQLGGTITSGQSGYDGSSDAWLISKDTSTFRSVRQVISWSGVSTFSVYAKEGSLSNAALRMDSSAGAIQILFNLSTGVPTYSGGVLIDYGTEDVGNGWWRLYITANVTSGTNVHIYVDRDGTTSGSIYIQDAQVEEGLVATEYIESGASTGLAGILEDSPRFDYSGGASCPSLLLEPSRTNLVEYSEYMLGSNWLGGQTSITPLLSPDLSPEGKLNAYRITRTSTNTQLGSLSTVTSGQTYTGSIYIKRVSGSYNARIKVVENTSTTIDITDEWKRFDLTEVATSSNGRLYISPFSTGDVIDVFGAQLEEGSYPTSYIPNHSGGSVTREVDYVNKTGLGSSVFNDDNLTLFFDFDYNAEGREGSTTKYRIFSDSSQLGIKGTSSTTRALQVLASGDFSGTINFNSANASRIKVALRITNGTCELFFNGVKDTETIDVSAAAPYNWDRIAILLDNSMNSSLNQCLGFPTALPDNQCIALTS